MKKACHEVGQALDGAGRARLGGTPERPRKFAKKQAEKQVKKQAEKRA
jgi:hypothetical protein